MTTSQFVGRSVPATIAYVATSTTGVVNPPQASINWNSASIGTAAADRVVFIVIVGGTDPLVSATIGGVSATICCNVDSHRSGIIVFCAPVPTGTTANVAMSFSLSTFAQNFRMFSLRATGLSSLVPADIWSDSGNSPPGTTVNGSVNAMPGGIMVGGFRNAGTNTSFSGISGKTFDDDLQLLRSTTWGETENSGPHAFSFTLSSAGSISWIGTVAFFN